MRELENIVERATVITRDEVIGRSDLPLTVQASDKVDDMGPNMTAVVEGLERKMIKEALAQSDGVQTRAADKLGITERALRYKLKKYGFQGEDPTS